MYVYDSFQGGLYIDILVAQGNQSSPPSHVKPTSPKCQLSKSYEREVKGNAYILTSKAGVTPSLSVPGDKQSLKISQPILCLQINISMSSEFTIDVTVLDESGSKRRFNFATAHKALSVTPLHAKLPLKNIPRNTWSLITLDLASITSGIYQGNSFKCIDSFTLTSKCKLRRICTLRQFILSDHCLPKAVDFPNGVEFQSRHLNFESFDSATTSPAQRAVQSAPKKLNPNETGSRTKPKATQEVAKLTGLSKNGSFDSLASSQGSEEIAISTRNSSAPAGKRSVKTATVVPQPPAPSKGGKSSSRIRARVYSNEKERESNKEDASPVDTEANQVSGRGFEMSDNGLFTFSSMPRTAPVAEVQTLKTPLSVMIPGSIAFGRESSDRLQHAKHEPQLSKKLAAMLEVERASELDEKENIAAKVSEEFTARTNVHTPSDYDWRNYAPPDTGRSASSVERSMLHSILDPHYEEKQDDLPNPLSAMEDTSMQSSKFNLSSRVDLLDSNKYERRHLASGSVGEADESSSYNMPSLENFRKISRDVHRLRESPPLVVREDEEKSPQTGELKAEDEEIELIFDPDLNCYFDPKTKKYYELRT